MNTQLPFTLSGAAGDAVRFPRKSYLYLFEPGSQLYRICEALENTQGWLSTLDLHHVSGSMAVSTKISQVRERGVPVERKEERISGRVVHFYRIRRESAA